MPNRNEITNALIISLDGELTAVKVRDLVNEAARGFLSARRQQIAYAHIERFGSTYDFTIQETESIFQLLTAFHRQDRVLISPEVAQKAFGILKKEEKGKARSKKSNEKPPAPEITFQSLPDILSEIIKDPQYKDENMATVRAALKAFNGLVWEERRKIAREFGVEVKDIMETLSTRSGFTSFLNIRNNR